MEPVHPNCYRPTWIEVNGAALRNNVHQVRSRLKPGCLLMAIVKANAYGHGALGAARIFCAAGVDRLAVAALVEGIELREGGLRVPIQVLGYTPGWLASAAVAYEITTTVFDLATARALDAAAAVAGKCAIVHVKVNTGMNRLGIPLAEAFDFLVALRKLEHLLIEGIFTHFATADLADKSFALQQFERFEQLLQQLAAAGLRPPLAHAANTAALLTLPTTQLDMVRCGIALYGLHPDVDETRLPAGFDPAFSWKAQVAHVVNLQPGESVSYGREFIAPKPMTVAVIPVGYADGFPRRPYHWGHVLLHGAPAPILGRVCMDQTIVDVTHIHHAEHPVVQGDEVVLLGRQGNNELTADEIGRRLHTINYDVVSRILSRVPRLYQD
jgi:alanine racemase